MHGAHAVCLKPNTAQAFRIKEYKIITVYNLVI